MMSSAMRPQTLDTIVATNLHADILSDLAAALAGSLGIAPTANLNPEWKTPSPDTLRRAAWNAKEYLADNDAHSFFEALGDQVITGPTLTNVNDFCAILVLEPHERPAA